jgi:dynein light intermediate chain
LKVLKAANQPICPIREKLFVEAFDEIIRQVTIDCSERGVMLGRVKNELMMTVVGYRTVYEEGVAWGKGKLGEGELGES